MRTAVVGLVVSALTAAFVSPAAANGRDPFAVSIHFRQGAEQHIVVGSTFGIVLSHDGGATWEWMCEDVADYAGMYDPDYAYTASGAIFATTFEGLEVMRDGCTFASTVLGDAFVTRVAHAGNALYIAASNMMDSKIYKSTDDGMTFPTSASPGMDNDWWQSIEVAPSDAQRVYLTGYRFMSGQPKSFLQFVSTNGGTSFAPMTMSGIATPSDNSTIDLVGISPTNPDTVYVKVTLVTGNDGDAIYRSTNAGQTWTKILEKPSRFGLAFIVRKDGTCVAGTRELGAWKSTDCATAATPTWTELTGAPHIGCLYENAAGEVWACTANYASPLAGIESDGYGIAKSTDLATWTPVLKFQDIQAPVSCPAGTTQQDKCVQRYMGAQSQWCCLVPQLGITSTAIDCTGPMACYGLLPDGAPDAGTTMVKPPEGCCDAGSGSSALLGLLVGGLLLSRRRRP
ncbi:MAG: hypothetical protein HOV81_43300 [Kofleriaceae bacterium]|nr:hypothetical protein [Kofleriaceae bacterium]